MSKADAMFPDPRVDANEYLEAHKVKPLFQELGTRLMFDRPADPNAYLLEQLTQMQKLQTAGKPVLFFNEADISTMFDMYDPTGKGDISIKQYNQARVHARSRTRLRAKSSLPLSARLTARRLPPPRAHRAGAAVLRHRAPDGADDARAQNHEEGEVPAKRRDGAQQPRAQRELGVWSPPNSTTAR